MMYYLRILILLAIVFLMYVPGVVVGSAGINQSETVNFDNMNVEIQYLREIETLTSHPDVQRAFAYIRENDEQTVADQILLNEIPAPPFMEDERAAKFAELLDDIGVDKVTIDEEGNVIGLRKGLTGDRTLVVSAHLDTVFPEGTDVSVEIRGDTLFAPGIVDDARGLASVLTILRAMNETGISTEADILFVGTVGEEGLGDLRGVKHLFRKGGPEMDIFISIDGSDDSRIVHQALGSHRYRVTFEGPGGHSWSAFGLANPAHALGRAITFFDEDAAGYIKNRPQTSYNIGRIGGGTSVNSIPFESWMEVDMRSVDQESLLGIDTVFQDAMQRALEEQNEKLRRGNELTVTIEMIGNRPSGEIAVTDPFIQRAMAATCYFELEPVMMRVSTDSNVPISMGIPSITIGGGGKGGGMHSLDEWWLNKDGYRGIQRALLIILTEARLSGS